MSAFQLHPKLAADTIELGSLTVCRVLLMNESQYPWVILVPERNDISELYELNEQDLAIVQAESIMVSKLMMQHFKGDKLNTGALGNIVPQLHLHHIVRFENDAVWPNPVWGNIEGEPYQQLELDIFSSELKQQIQQADNSFKSI